MQRSQLALQLLLALGLIVRVVMGCLQPDDLLADRDGYLAHAKPVAAGAGFLGPYTDRPTAFRPPGYPVLLGVLMACGLSDSTAVIIISLVSYIVIFAMTRTLALQFEIDHRWSLLAVLGVVLDPLLIRYSILPMTEVPCAAILLAAVVAFERFFSDGSTRNGRSIRIGIFTGVLFGIGTLFRPVVMIVCAFLTLDAIRRQLKRSSTSTLTSTAATSTAATSTAATSTAATSTAAASMSRVRGLLHAILPAIVAGLVLSPWIIRNAMQFRHFIPATTHGGYTLALGNNPDFYRDVINGTDEFPWDGSALDAWQKRMIAECESEAIVVSSEPAVDAWYYSRASAAIRTEPASFLKATLLRLRRFWAISTADPSAGNALSISLVMVWYIVLWTGLILQIGQACFGNKSTQLRSMANLWLAILAFLVMHSAYWTDTRMRAPLMPIMIVISVSGWQSASTYLRRGVVMR